MLLRLDQVADDVGGVSCVGWRLINCFGGPFFATTKLSGYTLSSSDLGTLRIQTKYFTIITYLELASKEGLLILSKLAFCSLVATLFNSVD